MGCCNKERDDTPVSRLRYWGGAVLLGAVHAGLLGALSLAALVEPRSRRVLPLARAFSRETMGSVLRRERIRVVGHEGRSR